VATGSAPPRSYHPPVSWRRVAGTSAALVAVVAVLLAAPVVALEFDEAAVPPSSDVPALPAGVTIAGEEVQCGSGGCWRELRLRGPEGLTPAEVAASVGPPYETCSARSLLDRRTVCSGIDVHGDDVVLHVQFDRLLSL